VQASISDWDALGLTYPDAAHDCEALAIDPRDSSLILVTKENDGQSRVFGASALAADGQMQTLAPLFGLAFAMGEVPGSPLVTSADISPMGDGVLVRTYDGVFFWRRSQGQTLEAALSVAAVILPPPPEEQGEAITFAADGRGLFTVAERTEDEPVTLFGACLP